MGAATPEWANWGNGGFNPEDERVYRKGKGPDGRDKAYANSEAKRVLDAEVVESGGCG